MQRDHFLRAGQPVIDAVRFREHVRLLHKVQPVGVHTNITQVCSVDLHTSGETAVLFQLVRGLLQKAVFRGIGSFHNKDALAQAVLLDGFSVVRFPRDGVRGLPD